MNKNIPDFTMPTPLPTHRKDPAAVKLGRKGGKAGTGKAKARPSETMRQAALKRWRMARANTK